MNGSTGKSAVCFTSDGGGVGHPCTRIDGPNRFRPRNGEVPLVGGARIPALGHHQLDGAEMVSIIA
jgi:hypothetical protein